MIPLGRYFGADGAWRLTLITGGGRFDTTARRHRDDVVVTATPGASTG
jgi:hypothetical protein